MFLLKPRTEAIMVVRWLRAKTDYKERATIGTRLRGFEHVIPKEYFSAMLVVWTTSDVLLECGRDVFGLDGSIGV